MTAIPLNVKDAGGNVKALTYTDDGAGTLTQHCDVDSLPSLPAGVNFIGSVEEKSIQTINRASISVAASGYNSLIALLSAKSIRILGIVLVAAAPVTVKFTDSASLDKSGAMSLIAGQPFILPQVHDYFAWMVGVAGRDIGITLGGAIQVSGLVIYTQY